LVPANIIKIFDYKELELLISGLPTIDIEDLKDNTVYTNYTKQSPVVMWLWEVLEELCNSERAEFIQFVTGSSKVPVEGFKALRGANGLQKFQVIKYQTIDPDHRLPQAHTCFFQLDLPEYSTKDILR
jgi:E3 ubiquitin-protein ligase HUWE1